MTIRHNFTSLANLKLLALDFDGVCGHNPNDMNHRCCQAAVATVKAYLDVDIEEAHKLVSESWNEYHDVMRKAADHPACTSDHQTMTRHYDFLTTHDVHVRPLEGVNPLLLNLMDDIQVIILSHSTTRLVQKIGMTVTDLPKVLMDKYTYGIDHPFVAFRRKDYHHDTMMPDIYAGLCERYDVAPEEAMLVDDSAVNLKFASAVGWQTTHIHWKESAAEAYDQDRPSYINYDFRDLTAGLNYIRAHHRTQTPLRRSVPA